MTYRDLLEKLQELNEEQLNADVTVYDKDLRDFYPAEIIIR